MSTTKTVNVTTGKVLHYTIKKTGYKPVSGSKLITGPETINVNMVPESSPDGVYVFGDRIGGCATFFGYFDSVNPSTQVAQKYACFVLDAAYRRNMTAWGPNLDTALPEYTISNALSAKESATYNTQTIYDAYTVSSTYFQAFYYSRNPGGQSLIIEVDGVNYTPQLPNAYELSLIKQFNTQLDALDPTLIDGTGTIPLFSPSAANYSYVWSSNESSTISSNGTAIAYTKFGEGASGWYLSTGYKTEESNHYIYPIFEIPVN